MGHGSQDVGAEEYATLEIVTPSGGELTSSGNGRQRHYPTKEIKALREFLGGIGEADVGAAPPDEAAAVMDGEWEIPDPNRAHLAKNPERWRESGVAGWSDGWCGGGQ
ncbi:hypothetical protein HK101_008792 [Irineochytrium annulatum]|nr:hypothetical protein HK101_008792 [Irineochytrium annulatum]